MTLTAVTMAVRLLSQPEGPSLNELRKKAREYLAGLSSEEYEELKMEAYDGPSEDEELDYEAKVEALKQLQFTDKEIQAYAKMRLDTPGVRRMIARRALLVKNLKQPLPPGATFYEVARMEDAFLRDMTDEQVLKELGVKPNSVVQPESEEDIIKEARAEVRRRVWASQRGKATRGYIREHPDLVEQYTNSATVEVDDENLPEHVTKASILFELSQRLRRRETAKAVRQWAKDNPELAKQIKEKAIREREQRLSHSS